MLRDAESDYDKAIAIDPGFTDAHINKAVLMSQSGRNEEALAVLNKAASLNPRSFGVYINLGNVLKELKRPDEALNSYDKAIALKPAVAEAHGNRGHLLNELGKPEEALASYDTAISLKPDYIEAHVGRGVVLRKLKRYQEALASCDTAIGLKPGIAGAHVNRGSVLSDLKRHDEAIASYDKAIALNPVYVEAYVNRGAALKELKRLEEAIASLDRAIQLNPSHAEAYSNRGLVLKELGRTDDALADYATAINLKPDYAEAHNNRGVALMELNRPEEALECYKRAIDLRPAYSDAYNNQGVALKELNRFDEALASYDIAMSLQAWDAEASYNKACLLLSLQSYEEGFNLYRSRWNTKNFGSRPMKTPLPAWTGLSRARHVLVWSEQGIGDEILYGSLLSLLPTDDVHVTLAADKRLHSIYERSFPGIALLDRTVQKNPPSAGFDAQAPIGDLGAVLGLDASKIGQRRYPFLVVDQERRHAIHRTNPFLKNRPVCGVSWKSANKNFGEEKSISLHDLAPILSTPDFTFVNLQYGTVAQDIEDVKMELGVDVHQADGLDVFNDIEGLLALIDNCDVVITTCNVTAHLAGAIGKKAAVLVPTGKGRLWYWQGEQSNVWYPSLMMFVQDDRGDWSAPIRRASTWIVGNTLSEAR
jgi:tetratricopeptide (TPR) repeat protein